MSYSFIAVIVAVLAYLIGSVSFAVVVSRALNLPSPHTYGSGNPGATNVLRTGNKVAALLTLLGDALKGWVVVVIAKAYFANVTPAEWIISVAVIAVFIGHLFPIFHRFKGGKGVATAAGILFGINPILGLATMATWLIIAFFFRYSSLAALASAAFAPLYCFFLFGSNLIGLAVALMSILLIWRHQSNIQNLLSGKESRIGKK
jgi:glycerol-3-phosphate acyltransferase PlsY